MDIMDESKREIHFDPIPNMPHTDTNIGDYEISDDIFSEEHHEEETMMQRKSFFAKLFSTN